MFGADLEEAEHYAIAGLFTLALHTVSSSAEGEDNIRDWGEPDIDAPPPPTANPTSTSGIPPPQDQIVFWGKDLIQQGLLDHVYTLLHLPPYKWDGLKALPCVAPASDRQAYYAAVKSLVGVLDPVLAESLPNLMPRKVQQQLLSEDAENLEEEGGCDGEPEGFELMPLSGGGMVTVESPLSPDYESRPNMAEADRLWDGLLTSSDDEDFKKDLEWERRVEESQKRNRQQQQTLPTTTNPAAGTASAAGQIDKNYITSTSNSNLIDSSSIQGGEQQGRLSRRQSIEAQELLKSLSDAAEQQQSHVDHSELVKALNDLELEIIPPIKETIEKSSEQDEALEVSGEPSSSEHSTKLREEKGKEEPRPAGAASASPAAVAAIWELLQCTIAARQYSQTKRAGKLSSPSSSSKSPEQQQRLLLRWYDSRSRAAVRQVAQWLQLSWRKVVTLEMLLGTDKTPSSLRYNTLDPEAVQMSKLRYVKVGLAAGAGGLLFAITGGLAAPAIAAGIGSVIGLIPGAGATAGAVAGFMGTQAGLAAVTGTMAGAGAATLGSKTAHRTGEVQEFGFLSLPDVGDASSIPLERAESSDKNVDPSSTSSLTTATNKDKDEEEPLPVLLSQRSASEGIRLSVLVGISGWISKKEEDFVVPWLRVQAPASDRFACVWETKELLALDSALGSLLAKQVAGQAVQLGVKHLLAAGAGLVAALAPTVLVGTAAGLLISNSWAVCMDRAEKAGKLLAQLLLAGGAGDRPVTLIAHGMGARLAFHCLLELCRNGARGIVQDAILLGAPVSRAPERWRMARRVVAGRLVNGYSKNDWLLSALCWEGGLAAGLAAVESPGTENVNLSEIVSGHLEYLDKMQDIIELLQLEL